MESYCSLFNYLLGIILIDFAAMCVSIITLVSETISFYESLLWEKTFERVVMCHQFVGLKVFFKPRTKVYVIYR